MDGNGIAFGLSFDLFRAHTARQSHFSLLHSVLYGVSHASLDRPHRLRNQRKESSQRRFRAALSCLFPFPFYFSSFIVRIALDSPLFRRLAFRSGSRQGRHRIHRRERFDLADHAGRTIFTPFSLISRSTCSKSRRKARFRGNSHL